MKIISQRLFPIVLNKPQEHIEVPTEGTLVKFYWNIGLQSQHDRFFKTTSYKIEQFITIEVYNYGQRIARYSNQWREGWDTMSALKTEHGFELPINNMTLRLTTAGQYKERKPRGYKGDPLRYPTKVAIQRLQ